MTSTVTTPPDRQQHRSTTPTVRRVGYAAAAACNAVLLWIVHQLSSWDKPRFLTEEFDELLPIITFSIVVSIIVNLVWLTYDPRWFKSVGSIATSAIGLVVATRTYDVFPFDFATYDVDWSWLARMIVIFSIVGAALAVIVETFKLASYLFRECPDPSPPEREGEREGV